MSPSIPSLSTTVLQQWSLKTFDIEIRGDDFFFTTVSVQAPRMVLTKWQEDILRFLRERGRVKSPDIEKAFSLTRARVGQIIKALIDEDLSSERGK